MNTEYYLYLSKKLALGNILNKYSVSLYRV